MYMPAPTYEPRVYLSYHLDRQSTEPYDRCMVSTLRQRLCSKNVHIYSGAHSPSLNWVHVAVVFINRSFLTNSVHHDLERLLEHKKLKGLKIIAVLYELNPPNSPLVTDIIAANPNCPDLGDQENARLGRLVSEFLNAASMKINIIITENLLKETMEKLADFIAQDINPFEIDYDLDDDEEYPHDDEEYQDDEITTYPSTRINHKLFYDVVNKTSNAIYKDIVNKPNRLSGPSLIAIFEACGLTNCCCEIDTISKIVYTHIYNWSRGLTFNCYLYLSLGSSISSSCSSSSSSSSSSASSLFDVFQHEMRTKYQLSYGSGDKSINGDPLLFFVVIDDIQSFVTETEDATQVLATFVNLLGSGSLVVTTSSTPISTRISEDPSIEISLECIRGSKCVLSQPKKPKRFSSGDSDSDLDSLPDTLFDPDTESEPEDALLEGSQQWPACFTIWNSQLSLFAKKLQHKEILACSEMDEDDDQKQKKSHAVDFEPSGNAQKKLKETVTGPDTSLLDSLY